MTEICAASIPPCVRRSLAASTSLAVSKIPTTLASAIAPSSAYFRLQPLSVSVDPGDRFLSRAAYRRARRRVRSTPFVQGIACRLARFDDWSTAADVGRPRHSVPPLSPRAAVRRPPELFGGRRDRYPVRQSCVNQYGRT